MKLAEALQERKTLDKQIGELWERLRDNIYRPEDDAKPDFDPVETQALLDAYLTRHENLVVMINDANNKSTVVGMDMTIMAAIAHRDRLARAWKGYDTVIAGQEDQMSYGRHKTSLRAARRTKDDLKFVATTDIDAINKRRDALAEEWRKLDIALQQTNWTVEL